MATFFFPSSDSCCRKEARGTINSLQQYCLFYSASEPHLRTRTAHAEGPAGRPALALQFSKWQGKRKKRLPAAAAATACIHSGVHFICQPIFWKKGGRE